MPHSSTARSCRTTSCSSERSMPPVRRSRTTRSARCATAIAFARSRSDSQGPTSRGGPRRPRRRRVAAPTRRRGTGRRAPAREAASGRAGAGGAAQQRQEVELGLRVRPELDVVQDPADERAAAQRREPAQRATQRRDGGQALLHDRGDPPLVGPVRRRPAAACSVAGATRTTGGVRTGCTSPASPTTRRGVTSSSPRDAAGPRLDPALDRHGDPHRTHVGRAPASPARRAPLPR